jgi:hypothetical protein
MVGADREERLDTAVERHFKLNFFLMQSQATKQMTRAEFLGRQSEQIASLVPIFGRFTSEVLDQMWGMLSRYATVFGILPEAPQSLVRAGVGALEIEYQSPMMTLQKRAHGMAGVEAFVSQVSQLNQAVGTAPPDVLDAFDMTKVVDQIADANGVQTILTDDKTRKASKDARAQAEQMRAQAEQQMQMAAAMGGQQ